MASASGRAIGRDTRFVRTLALLVGLAGVPGAAAAAPVRLGASELPELAPADAALLDEALRDGLEQSQIEITEQAGDSPIIRLRIERAESDYEVSLTVTAATGESVVAEASETCELCGVAELRDTIVAVTARLRQRLDLAAEESQLVVDSSPSGATVRLDGAAIGATPLQAEILAGEHDLSVEHRGFVRETSAFVARPGAEAQFSVSLRRQPHRRWLPWTMLGVGIASAAAGGALIAVDGDPIASDCNPDSSGNCEFLRKTQTGGIALVGVGGAAIVTGVVLAIAWRRKSSTRKRRASAHPMGVQWRF